MHRRASRTRQRRSPARIGAAIAGIEVGRADPLTGSLAGRGRDAGWEAHHAAIAHLTACADALDAEDAGELTDVESPAVGPYCGCMDCEVRETLAAAWPILLDDAAAIAEEAGYTGAAQVLRAETARVRQLLGMTHPGPLN